MLVLNIPMLPVSVNHQYSQSRWGNVFLTQESKIYRHTVETLAKQAVREQGWKYLEREFVKITILYTTPKGWRGDLQNDKLTFDSLEGIVYKNDKQIIDLRMVKVFGNNSQETTIFIQNVSKKNYEQFIESLLQVAAEKSRGAGSEISGESERPA